MIKLLFTSFFIVLLLFLSDLVNARFTYRPVKKENVIVIKDYWQASSQESDLIDSHPNDQAIFCRAKGSVTIAKNLAALSCSTEYYLKRYFSDTLSILVRDAVETPNNEQIIVGSLFNPSINNDSDPFILKLNAVGEKVWEKNFNIPSEQHIYKMTALADGSYAAAGTSQIVNQTSCFLLKFDSNGNVLWNRKFAITISGVTLFTISEIKEDADNNIIVVGSFYLAGRPRLFFLKSTSSGSILLSKSVRPPLSTVFMGATDIMVKDGFTYISGSHLNTGINAGYFRGLLVKINNTNGNVVFGKQYNFNSGIAMFSQLLDYTGQICLIGLNGIQGNANIAMLCDTSGMVSQVKSLQFSIIREPGRVYLKNDGSMIWFQNSDNNFFISAFHLQNGVSWTRQYNSPGDFPRAVHVYEGNNGNINFAGNFADGQFSSLFSGVFSGNGNMPCAPAAISSTIGNGSSVAENIAFLSDDFTIQEISLPWLPMPEKVNAIDTICQTSIICNQLNLSAPSRICFGDTLKVVVDVDCNTVPSINYDPLQLQLLSVSDTLLQFLPLKTGLTKISAGINPGCNIIRDSVLVAVSRSANSLNLGSDLFICNGNSITLNASSGFKNYQWQDGSSDSFYLVTVPGLYYLTVLDSCGKMFRDSVVVNSGTGLPISIGPDRVKCNGDTLHLNAPPGYMSYSWSPDYRINSLQAASVVIDPYVDTVYYLKAEVMPGCYVYDTIRITVHNSPTISLGPDTSLCRSEVLSLRAGTGFSNYQWSNGDTDSLTTVNSIGTYFVHAITPDGCSSTDTIKILTIYDNPFVMLGTSNELCTGGIRLLDAGVFNSYLWNDGSVARTLSIQTRGTYFVTVTDKNSCYASDTILIDQLLPVPQHFLPADTSICLNSTFTLGSLKSFPSYVWNTGSIAPNIVITVPGIYWLEVKDAKNCIGRDSIEVNVNQCGSGLYVPAAFTPNLDGTNDFFKATLYGVRKSFELKLYNRYGQLIFVTRDPQEGWDGTIKGIKQETGGYVWVCKYQVDNRPVAIEKGSVILIR